jgi:hypothetical protein
MTLSLLAKRSLALSASIVILSIQLGSALSCEVFAGYQAQEFDDDMSLQGEGKPHGVPLSYSWSLKGRVGAGNKKKSYTAITAWGQIFQDKNGTESTNVRIQIRRLRLYVLDENHTSWRLLQNSDLLRGAHYKEDYGGNVKVGADIRHERSGGISFVPKHGWNFHFYPPSRAPISDISPAGILAIFEARLIPDDPGLVADLHQANFLMSAGADYWAGSSSNWDHFKTNTDVGIGRFKRITTEWRWASMTTASIAKSPLCPPEP